MVRTVAAGICTVTNPTTDDVRQAQLLWDAEGRPRSSHFDDIYFSTSDGLEETRYVFLRHNDLAQRWSALPAGSDFSIAETGFGTGLNFLAAWQMWREQAPPQCRLHFISVERYPLSHADLHKALALWPQLDELIQPLLAAYPPVLSHGFHRLWFDQGQVCLTLIIDEASSGFAQLLNCEHPRLAAPRHRVDAWFLDGFAPAKNPDMWSEQLFTLIGQLSHADTTAATFTCAGIVKRGLKNAGFHIEKVPGFGRKREMLQARRSNAADLPPPDASLSTQAVASVETQTEDSSPRAHSSFNGRWPAPWWVSENAFVRHNSQRTAIIIGAGLAGCHSAQALARRGWQVILLEAGPAIAQGGSGNPQGVLYAKLSHRRETLGDFNLSSLLYAQHCYAPLWEECGSRCGVLQLMDSSQTATIPQLLTRLGRQELLQSVSQRTASALAGIEVNTGGLWFPGCGWLQPAAVCRTLIDLPNIQLYTNTAVAALRPDTRDAGGWQALDAAGTAIASAAIVIVANANQVLDFEQTAHLPIKPVRGQITNLPANTTSVQLQTVLCGEGYIAPARHGQHTLGASFAPKQTHTDLQLAEQQQNLQRLGELSTLLASATPSDLPLAGRAALRATSPDYLPLVGQLAEPSALQTRFAPLGKNAKAAIDAGAPVISGLYVNVGHGSRGLAYTPLCAELLASQIHGDMPPVGWEFARALNPNRFLIRDIIRHRAQ